MIRFICLLLVLAFCAPGLARAQSCATPYRHVYHKPVVHKPYVAPQVDYAVFPIAVYVPVPLFTTTAVQPVPGPVASAASPGVSGAISSPAPAPAPALAQASMSQSDVREVLTALRDVTGALQSIDARLRVVEARVGIGPPPAGPPPGPAPAPVPPAPVPAGPPPDQPPPDPFNPPKAALAAPAGLRVLASACAGCHDRKVAAVNGDGRVFLDGGRLIADKGERLRMADAVRKGRMPAADSGVRLSAEDRASLLAYLDQLS